MAVLRMKRLTVVAPASRRETLLSRLQDLGALHLVPFQPDAEVPAEQQARLQSVKRCRQELEARSGKALQRREERSGRTLAPAPGAGTAPAPLLPPGAGGLAAEQVEPWLARRQELEKRLAALSREREQALPWGRAVEADLVLLAAAGLQLRAWRGSRKGLARLLLPPEAWSWVLALPGGRRDEVLLLLGSFAGPPPEPGAGFEPLAPPHRPLPEVERELAEVHAGLAQVDARLDGLVSLLPRLRQEEGLLADGLRLAEARAQAAYDGDVFAVAGWCPAIRAAEVKDEVLRQGGAVLLDDPGPEDEPPVAVKNGPLVRFFEPLLKAFQLPHYREPDPTLLFAPFMALFFGLCIGDAGYGVLLTISSLLLGRLRSLRRGEAHKATRLMLLLGLSTTVVGLLQGSVFGVALYELAPLQRAGLRPDMLLFSLSSSPEKFFTLALLLGVVQVSVGILWRMGRQLLLGRYQAALGTLGWLGLIPGAALWYYRGQPWPIAAAFTLLTLFKSPSPSLIRRLGGGVWGWYEWAIGLFGDVMSYLRIFGLGLSSGIIAQVVNEIAGMVGKSAGGVGVVVAGLVLIFGHGFNFAMSVLGSTIHSARLQFLEFFGKFFEGGGQPYSPFRREAQGG